MAKLPALYSLLFALSLILINPWGRLLIGGVIVALSIFPQV